MTRIPNEFHFVFGLRPQTEAFHLAYFLCLESAIQVNQPEQITFYYHHEPFGTWWELIKPKLNLERIEPESFITDTQKYLDTEEGQFIRQAGLDYAHHADFLRLKILNERGGVYADIDTIFVNRLPTELFGHSFVLGEEDPIARTEGSQIELSLCNALIMAEARSDFGKLWLERMYERFDGTWSKHSCQTAAELCETLPGSLHVVPSRYFYKHMWTKQGIHTLLEGLDPDYDGVYSMHLWNHLWWEHWRRDFSDFNNEMLTVDYIRNIDTTYNLVARKVLETALRD